MKEVYLKVRLLLGILSLVSGLFAANLAIFEWRNPDGFFYLLGAYAQHACAYAGFASIILGAMLINDFSALRSRCSNDWEEAEKEDVGYCCPE